MQRDEQVFYRDIARAVNDIQNYTAGLKLEGYLDDGRTRHAVERCLEIIGEALAQLRRLDESLLADIPGSRQLIGMRNVLVHEYGRVDDVLIWQAVHTKLTLLQSVIQSKLEISEDE